MSLFSLWNCFRILQLSVRTNIFNMYVSKDCNTRLQLVWLKWNCYETRALRTIILFLNWYQTLYPTTLQWIPNIAKPIWIYRNYTRWYESLHIQSYPRVKLDNRRQYQFPYLFHGGNSRKYIGEVALEYVLQTSKRAQCFHDSRFILFCDTGPLSRSIRAHLSPESTSGQKTRRQRAWWLI